MTDTRPSPPRRRRLWQLPTQAHELLLSMSFTPDALRREASRLLGRQHRGVCVLQGRDVDVLYSVVHDMGTRNALSEGFQKRLDERHALAVRRLAPLREASALQAAWAQALQDRDMTATLWALLTHPRGAELEAAALYDARHAVFTLARQGLARAQGQAQADLQLQQALAQADALRARLGTQQQQAAQAIDQARNEIARLHGELARRTSEARTAAAEPVATPAPAADRPRPATRSPAARVAPAATGPGLHPAPHPAAPQPAAHPAPQPSAPQVVVRGRRVLCVGGIQHAVARYRGRIEKLGGHFEHHDGGLEDSVQALDGRLGRADLVICQAGCINHEAYHRVKRHCERTGTPCVYLDRPSLSRLDRALVEPLDGPGLAAQAPSASATR